MLPLVNKRWGRVLLGPSHAWRVASAGARVTTMKTAVATATRKRERSDRYSARRSWRALPQRWIGSSAVPGEPIIHLNRGLTTAAAPVVLYLAWDGLRWVMGLTVITAGALRC